MNSEKLTELIKSNEQLVLEDIKDNLGDLEIRILPENVTQFFTELKNNKSLNFNMLLSVTAVDLSLIHI